VIFELIYKTKIKITKEVFLSTMSELLSDKSLLKRLYSGKLDSCVEYVIRTKLQFIILFLGKIITFISSFLPAGIGAHKL